MKTNHSIDTPYLMLLNKIRNEGHVKSDRTNTGTVSLFGNMIKLDVRGGYIPLLTTKKIFFESFIKETIWFMSGSTDVGFLKENNVGIWDEWVIPETSVWREYTLQEYTTAHKKLFNTEGDYSNQVCVASFKDAYNWLRCHEEVIYQQYRKAHPVDANIDNLRAFVHGKVEIPNMKLVSGSIGNGAYGSLWRNWEDTRIVSIADYERIHKAHGYKLVVKMDDSKCVITRNIDQLANIVQQLKTSPDSRRIVLSAWNPGRLEEAALPPCHTLSQYFTRLKRDDELTDDLLKRGLMTEYLKSTSEDKIDDSETIRAYCVSKGVPIRFISSMLFCRSQDFAVGTPFNIPQYVMLLNVLANITGMDVEEFTWVGGDTHLYSNHLEMVKDQLARTILADTARITINRKLEGIDDVKIEDIQISNYSSHPSINYPIAV